MASAKRDAIRALLAASHHCPGRLDQEAFWEYQNRVMEPLRENIRHAVRREMINRAALEAALPHLRAPK